MVSGCGLPACVWRLYMKVGVGGKVGEQSRFGQDRTLHFDIIRMTETVGETLAVSRQTVLSDFTDG